QHLLDSRRDGVIVVVSSLQADFPIEDAAIAYVMAKSGLGGMVRALALRYAREGIRVNAVAPGVTHTPMAFPPHGQVDDIRALAASIPVGRVAEPDEIASAITFLASDDARYIHGQTLTVD